MRLSLLALFLIFVTLRTTAQETFTYYDDLQLDLYRAANGNSEDLLIYVHGGGFVGGTRAEGKDYCTVLSENGINCASVSYTLSMKGRSQDWSCDGILTEKLKTLQLAANEVWAATRYLTGPDAPLTATPQRVYLAGSSAGAEAVLHAGFYDRTTLKLINHGLDSSFHYAGIISGAGALVDANLITPANAAPLLLFHGTDDPLVPYGAGPHHRCAPDDSGWLMLFGAGPLADRMEEIGESFALYTHLGAGHGIAGRYFHGHYAATLDFLRRTRGETVFQERHRVNGQ